MKELGLETRQADEETKRAWAKQLPNIPKQRFEEINKAKLPGEVVYVVHQGAEGRGPQVPARLGGRALTGA